MSPHDEALKLHELTDDQVNLLYEICDRASRSDGAPFVALFDCYEDVFREHHLDTARDNVVFRYMFHIGNAAKNDGEDESTRRFDFVEGLHHLMGQRGTLLDTSTLDGEQADKDETIHDPPSTPRAPVRRVSFDDAHLEETWLSKHSPLRSQVPAAPLHLLSLPPRRPGNAHAAHIHRPASSQASVPGYDPPQQPAPDDQSLVSAEEVLDNEDDRHPQILFDLSQTQLSWNAEAFLETSELRFARRCWSVWREQSLALQYQRLHANNVASTHDKRTLFRQAIDALRAAFQQRLYERERQRVLHSLLDRHLYKRDRWLLVKAFSHWDESAQDQKRVIALAQRHLMKVKYFQRWHRIAVESAARARVALLCKYVRRWRELAARQTVRYAVAEAQAQQFALRNCWQRWSRYFRARRAAQWHDEGLQIRTWRLWQRAFAAKEVREQCAVALRDRWVQHEALQRLHQQSSTRQQASDAAQRAFKEWSTTRVLVSWRKQAQLAPLLRDYHANLADRRKRNVLQIWFVRMQMSVQADDISRRRALQVALTCWNDRLRSNALIQRINARVLIENLYRWVLQERLCQFRRRSDQRLLSRAVRTWREQTQQQHTVLAQRCAVFADQQRHRQLRTAIVHLHTAFRQREAHERLAVEFVHRRRLPQTLALWKSRAHTLLQLSQWAVDARFYCVATRSLALWRQQTSDHKHQRRRAAYAHIRTRIRTRQAHSTLAHLYARLQAITALRRAAETAQHARLLDLGIAALDVWHARTLGVRDALLSAAALHRQHMLRSVLAALLTQHHTLASQTRLALHFHSDSNALVLLDALKTLQWAAFTAARRRESADALCSRSRDQHLRQMLRHWLLAATHRRNALVDPESSPSLRPASRAAARASSTPPTSSTPAYLRTPSRLRRAARFQPLATPALITPMAFGSEFLLVPETPVLAHSASAPPVPTPVTPPPAARSRTGAPVPAVAVEETTPAAPPPLSALRRYSLLGRASLGKSVRFAAEARRLGLDGSVVGRGR